MSYTIVGSHCDGAFSIEDTSQPKDASGEYPRKEWETKQEAINAADQLQQESDAAGYRERFTVFAERCREVYCTRSNPATLYHVRFHTDESDENGQTMRVPGEKKFKEFVNLDEAKAAATIYPEWFIYRTYDYRLVDSSRRG